MWVPRTNACQESVHGAVGHAIRGIYIDPGHTAGNTFKEEDWTELIYGLMAYYNYENLPDASYRKLNKSGRRAANKFKNMSKCTAGKFNPEKHFSVDDILGFIADGKYNLPSTQLPTSAL